MVKIVWIATNLLFILQTAHPNVNTTMIHLSKKFNIDTLIEL